MASIDIVSDKVKLIRQANKLTQSELAKKSGVSQSQISTIENGDCNVKLSTLAALADALQVSLCEFFSDYSTNKDQYIIENEDDEYEVATYQYKQISLLNVFYPKPIKGMKISTLMEFLVYFPLIDINRMFMVLSRIYGDFNSREEYISNQLEWLVKCIPNSPAKQYADYIYSVIQKRKEHNSPEIMADPDVIDGGYDEYCNLLEKKQAFYRELDHIIGLHNDF